MKILVVQLLRLGDILLSAPVISGLRKKFPNAEIHFLGFKQFRQVEDLFIEKIVWHWINRGEIQASIGDPNASFVHAFDLLKQDLAEIGEIEFDHVFNLTQTKFSGWICAGLKCKQVSGMCFDARGEVRFGSPWFQYLNDHVSSGQGPVFHFTDVFRFGCDLESEIPEWNFRRAKAPSIRRPFVLFQPLTSDEKKNYPLSQWRKVMEIFSLTHPATGIVILAAPNEEKLLRSEFGEVAGLQIVVCDLKEALSLMDAASLLVTGDTSIKHLACASLLPVLELSMGSSNYRKTGVYKTGSFVLQGKTACAPCPHASPCSRPTHECAKQITPEAVAVGMHLLLSGAEQDNRRVTGEFASQIEWLETSISPMGFWVAKDLNGRAPELELMQWIDKSTWKFLLQREFLNPFAPFGTEGLNIRRSFLDRFSETALGPIREHLDFMESEIATTDQNVGVLLNSMERLLKNPLNLANQEECLESVREFCDKAGESAQPLVGLLAGVDGGLWPQRENVISLTPFRRLQTRLDEINRKTQIKLKLIRSLRSQLASVGGSRSE